MGCIYKRGKKYWIKYYRHGKHYAESSQSSKKAVAERLLRLREGEIAQGKLPGICFERITFDELIDDFILDYKVNGKRSLERAQHSATLLRKSFGGMKSVQVNTPAIKKYIAKRQAEGMSNATINRELSAIKRAFNLGFCCTPQKVAQVPYIPMLKENNVRKGFLEHGDFIALKKALPEYLKNFVTFAYKYGWRLSEIAGLTWNQVDLNQGIVTLNPGETKNDEGRTVYLDDELKEVFQEQWEARKQAQKILPYVFLNKDKTDRIKQFNKAWASACGRAKIGARLFHDLRRTAIRNMIRAGIPERVAMMISGHKTRSVFDRYNIVSDSDLRLAAQRQEEYLKAQMVTKTVTIAEIDNKKGYSYVS